MDEEGSLPVPPAPAGAAVATYVSLFLLLFVFFIVLVSISDVQRPRARAVLDSIDAAFGHLPSTLGVIAPSGPPPGAGGVEGFARDVSGLLTGFSLQARTGEAAPGDSFLEVTLPEDAVFAPGGTTPRSAVLPTLDRLALMMQKRGPGSPAVRLTWRAVLPAGAPADGEAARLAGRRAAAAVAYLFAEGCPGDALAIAVERGPEPMIRLDFSVMGGDVPGAGEPGVGDAP